MEIQKYQLKPVPRQISNISPHDDIYITIEIGNGQIGASKVLFNSKLLAKGNLSKLTLLGNAEELSADVIETATNVQDANPFTNACAITTTFVNQEDKVLFKKIDEAVAPEKGIVSFNGKYLLKLLMMLLYFTTIFNIELNAQSSGEKMNFQSLETPSSPGFILLDQAPSAIEKPTTPQGVGLSLLGLQKNGGALEFAPFWLMTHPKLTVDEMYKNKFPALYNFSVSVASIKADSSNLIAGGFRTRLFQTYGKNNIKRLDSIKTHIEDALVDLDTIMIDSLFTKYSEVIQNPIFTIDIAAAIGGGSSTNSFRDLELKRWAAWLSINWRPKGNDFYITALARYINNEKYGVYTVAADLIDIGTRLNYDISNFSLSLEYLHRINITENKCDDYRVAIIGSYKVSDNLFITSTFGKNFTDINNIIALVGVNFGFSKRNISAY